MSKRRFLIAAGGTGGHLFPAQALAEELLQKGDEVIFAGGGLASNPYFDRSCFSFKNIESMTPFGGKKRLLQAPWYIGKGVVQSLKLLKEKPCDIAIGFGSFHAFPVLVAAHLNKVPIIVFEPNAIMGRVNRLFSKRALFTALQFEETERCLARNRHLVAFPFFRVGYKEKIDPATYFSLDPNKKTLLVVGGSQGAKGLNDALFSLAPELTPFKEGWQLLHLTGARENTEKYQQRYEALGVPSCVKPFEDKMALAWEIADLALCRSGAATVAEQLAYEVPAIFVPFPYSAEDHQRKNGAVIEKIGGAYLFEEKTLMQPAFKHCILSLLMSDNGRLETMKESLRNYNQTAQRDSLVSHIEAYVSREKR